METLFYIFVVLFAVSVVGWVASLFFLKRSMTPMLVFFVLVTVSNLGIQFIALSL